MNSTDKIIREEVPIDDSIFLPLMSNCFVSWALFHSDEPAPFCPDILIERLVSDKKTPLPGKFAIYKHSACFAALCRHDMNELNRIAFYIEATPERSTYYSSYSISRKLSSSTNVAAATDKALDMKIANRFLNLLVSNRMLPKYTPNDLMNEEARTGLLVIDTSNISPSLLYLYLCSARYVQEVPEIPYITVQLVDKFGMNFYLAFVVAHELLNCSSGHSCLSISVLPTKYTTTPNMPDVCDLTISRTSMLQAHALNLYSLDPNKYDSRKHYTPGSGPFNLQPTLQKAADCIRNGAKITRNHSIKLKELFDEDLIASVMSTTEEASIEMLLKFLSKQIEYVKAGTLVKDQDAVVLAEPPKKRAEPKAKEQVVGVLVNPPKRRVKPKLKEANNG